ncbi:hypothetical protein WME90_45305 [Sorangium sp. So ce375]|uniref:hypothetical protein n=1 Tax=Sorangium sp. So ce375 TaxID=3133306 RepID=UPI003F5C6A1A
MKVEIAKIALAGAAYLLAALNRHTASVRARTIFALFAHRRDAEQVTEHRPASVDAGVTRLAGNAAIVARRDALPLHATQPERFATSAIGAQQIAAIIAAGERCDQT